MTEATSKFRNVSGTRYLKALFFEYNPDKSVVVYTLKDRDHEGFPSLYRLYMEAEDVTEWEFANQYLDGWEHWQMLCECNWFKPYVERWRQELELKLRARALARIMKEAATTSKNAYNANKYLSNAEWRGPEEAKAKRGRPSAAKIKEEAQRIVDAENLIKDDYTRILGATN